MIVKCWACQLRSKFTNTLTDRLGKREKDKEMMPYINRTLVFNSERVNSRPRIKGRGCEICRWCSKAIMEPGCRYVLLYARCVSRTTERTNDRARTARRAGSREVRYVNYRPTYVSLSRSTASLPQTLAVGYLGCQPIRLETAPSPVGRSRCTQGSRETDESTLRPETFRFALFPTRCESSFAPLPS